MTHPLPSPPRPQPPGFPAGLPSGHGPNDRSRIERWIEILTILYGLFIVYSSLVPFDFSWAAPSSARGTLWGIDITGTNLPDVMSNLALYLPLGLLLRASFGRRGMSPTSSVLAALGVAIGLCFAMEWFQTCLISRVSSISDCVSDVLGAALGIALYAPESALAVRMAHALRAEGSRDRTTVHVGGWAVLTALTSLAPLDLTFDPTLFARAIRSAWFVPFGKHHALAEQARSVAGDSLGNYHFALIQLWQLRLDYIADVFMFLVLGVLLARRFRACGYRSVTTMPAAVACTTLSAFLISGAGLFVMSVGFDATHIVTGALGGLLGSVLYSCLLGRIARKRRHRGAATITSYRRAIGVGIVMCVLYISARELVPFRIDSNHVLAKMSRIEWLPLHAYSLTKLPQAALDGLHKSFRFTALGLFLSLYWIARQKRIGFGRCFAAGFGAAMGVAGLEFAQCWLPGRVPAITDVLIAACTTAVGVALGEILFRTYRQAITSDEPPPRHRTRFNVELPPVERSESDRARRDPRARSRRCRQP